MRRGQSGQALVEWAAVAFVLLLFALGLVAIGQIVGEYGPDASDEQLGIAMTGGAAEAAA